MNSGYKHHLNLLILTGIICQGYSWDNIWAPMVYALLGILAMAHTPKKNIFSPNFKALILLVAFLFFKSMSVYWGYGFNKLIYLAGNFLFVYQVINLLEDSTLREKKTAFLVALIHIGAGTQVIVDFKALIMIGAALILIPLTLKSMACAEFPKFATYKTTKIYPQFKECLILAVMMSIFFVAFPRFGFQSRQLQPLLPGAGVATKPSQELDSSSSGNDAARQLIFRIEGENIGYLKTHAYDEFDGVKWTASHWSKKVKRSWQSERNDFSSVRMVRMVNYKVLGDTLPVDGYVQNLKVHLYTQPFIAGDGSVKTGFDIRNNVNYTYWTLPDGKEDNLNPKEILRYTALPPENFDRIKQWLNSYLLSTNKPVEKIEKLLSFFHTQFQYDLGGPDLNRINPLEEFIFDSRKGHCERFASAMAVLLRLQNIPSRIGIGYVPVEKNEIGDFYNISSKNAHAWTEAFIPGQGWKIVDATPFGEGVQIEHRNLALTVLESIEYFWYSKIVEFGVNEQQEVFNWTLGIIKDSLFTGYSYIALLFPLAIGIGLIFLIIRCDWRTVLNKIKINRLNSFYNRRREAGFIYTQMLNSLERQKHVRKTSQTPFEYLAILETSGHPHISDIRLITLTFCSVRYGQCQLTGELLIQMQTALHAIKS